MTQEQLMAAYRDMATRNYKPPAHKIMQTIAPAIIIEVVLLKSCSTIAPRTTD